ncbi:tyrosine--tRNA ligase [Pseudenhygromyxa sp. WMMC2535]|uniref:tyrosine--tRNA ligase n=1 Tax=Pseudenhygromyxa sp. WMMC2535 TaxID=2712867 RepID=UPI001556C422|nr:tyrosine--tRNA ligase [Pseudenhygromyxa sp. WMMC2535]NVB39738.1 tyrosine--tRNA ligase [Pseudenhygromyxa sp. WMMC2535]
MADQPPSVSSPALQVLIERGFFEQASDLAVIDAAMQAGMVTFYNGYDPTADSLHAGSLLTIMAMRHLQRAGHRPIVLMGGATAMVGDPSGRSETRKLVELETIERNCEAIQRQFARFVHFDEGTANDAIMVDNSRWLMGLGYIEFLRDIGRHFSVNRMVAAKTYRDRLESELPLSFLEFNYQLLQAYDFLHLKREEGCDLQVGGSDQWGNMIAGVELIRRVAAEQGESTGAYCLTYPLLTTADGNKMGKTFKGAVWLDPDKFSPFDYYQYWINCHDRDVEGLLRYFTELPIEEINGLANREGRALNEAKAVLAFEATKMLHGEDEAGRARTASVQAFGGGDDWSAVDCVEIAESEIRLLDLVVHDQVVGFKSKREARERIKSGAVKLDGEVVTEAMENIDAARCGGEGLRLQIGRKRRVRVKLVG